MFPSDNEDLMQKAIQQNEDVKETTEQATQDLSDPITDAPATDSEGADVVTEDKENVIVPEPDQIGQTVEEEEEFEPEEEPQEQTGE